MMLTDEKRQAIIQALGNADITSEELRDPDTTADSWFAVLSELEGTPGWEEPLQFDADDLAGVHSAVVGHRPYQKGKDGKIMKHYRFGLGEVLQEIDKGIAHAEDARSKGGFVDREGPDYHRGYRDALTYIRQSVAAAAAKTVEDEA